MVGSDWGITTVAGLLAGGLVAAVPGSVVATRLVKRRLGVLELPSTSVFPAILVPHSVTWVTLAALVAAIGTGLVPGPLDSSNKLIGVVVGGGVVVSIYLMNKMIHGLGLDAALEAGILQLSTSWALVGGAYWLLR